MEQEKFVLSVFVEFNDVYRIPPVIASLFTWSARPQCVCIFDAILTSATYVGKRDITEEIKAEGFELNDGDKSMIRQEHIKEMVLVLSNILSAAGVSHNFEVDHYNKNFPAGKLCARKTLYMRNS